MATNINITTYDNCAIIYLADGSTIVVDPNSGKFLQLGDLEFCTISEAKDPDEAEHPPPAFFDKMIAFWQGFFKQMKADIQDPEATPLPTEAPTATATAAPEPESLAGPEELVEKLRTPKS